MSKFIIEEQTSSRIIIVTEHAETRWEIDLRADFGEDSGIVADIIHDGIFVTSAEFSRHDKHENEPRS